MLVFHIKGAASNKINIKNRKVAMVNEFINKYNLQCTCNRELHYISYHNEFEICSISKLIFMI